MRRLGTGIGLVALGASIVLTNQQAFAARHTAQAARCSAEARDQKLSGAERAAFVKTCLQGPLTPKTPTAPVPSNKEARAVVAPSGSDRTARSKQCDTEADHRKLSGPARSQFKLSCLATAGPVTEGETGTQAPKPAKQINGIGINRYSDDKTRQPH